MKIETQVIEVIDGKEVTQIRLTNDKGTTASFLTLGATWQEFLVVQSDATKKNVVLGHDRPSDYLKNGICAGQSVGRVAGRIKLGQVTLDNQFYQLPQNNNGNCLHGGNRGFHRQHWNYELTENGVVFSYQATETEDGFPGDMLVRVHYQLDHDNRLRVTYTGSEASCKTLFNPTNHVYFNLSTRDDLSSHTLFIASDQRVETDEQLIPSGRLLDVTDTDYDFRSEKSLQEAIEKTGGLDDAFVLSGKSEQPVAQLTDHISGNRVSIYSDRNGLVVYSFNFPEDGVVFSRSKHRQNLRHEGVALEVQTLPDAIHHSTFGNIVLEPHQTVSYDIIYEFE